MLVLRSMMVAAGDVRGEGGERALVTRDLLGGGCSSKDAENKELDLDLKVPLGWEKRLDLQSGEVYLHRSSPTARAPLPPPPIFSTGLLQGLSPNLELNLHTPPPATYQSVCTLDKVRSALHRLEAAKGGPRAARALPAEEEPMVAAGCSSCLSYVLVPEGSRRCPRCGSAVEVSNGRKRRRGGDESKLELDLNLH